MKRWFLGLFCLLQLFAVKEGDAQTNASSTVYILPVRDDIMPPLVYVVRRGVKEAMDAKADVLVLDMETNGGRVDTTEEIIQIIEQFKGLTVTYVNRKAFSAGAFISFATKEIYMAPQSVIGAAAPVMMSPGGGGAEGLPDTMEVKMTSALSALVRANAEKNGHNVEVADAMVKKTKELIIDGKVLNEKGQILTLTDREAATEYGDPPKPLLSAGTISSIEELLREIGHANAKIVRIEPTGAEKIGSWINKISPLLLAIGMIAFYLEFKTPGFGLPGAVGIVAFSLYFMGGYIAGLSGAEWVIVFMLGLVLVVLEFFVFPGTVFLGLAGVGLILVSLIMAFVDIYPGTPTWPTDIRFKTSLQDSIETFGLALVISAVAAVLLARILPKTPLYASIISQTTSGSRSEMLTEKLRATRLGQTGVALSTLRPGGRAQFGDEIVDVMSRGEMIEKGQPVKIVGFSGPDAIVESVG
ncbi:MAG: nodulation protein NfeD [Verrucomicrobia bacterium]|nr:nodulation protein NfeD [Verrucomicrobiota bacterium]